MGSVVQEAGDRGFLPGSCEQVQAWVDGLRSRFAQAQASERAARMPVDTGDANPQVP